MSKPKTRIQKGKQLEDYCASQIIEKGIDVRAERSKGSGSGNREKADISTSMTILGRNAGIECKNHKNAAVKDWWRQAKKLETLGREPVLVYKTGGEGLQDTKVIIYLNTFLDLVRMANKVDIKVETKEYEQKSYNRIQAENKFKMARDMIRQGVKLLNKE